MAESPSSTSAPAVEATPAEASSLTVAAGEDSWTEEELTEVRTGLEADRDRLLAEIVTTERDLQTLLRGGMDGAGNDQADVGSNSLERDSEMSLAANQRELLTLVDSALSRIAAGTYGVCELCSGPIGKLRLMAFPRASMCLSCKQREERR